METMHTLASLRVRAGLGLEEAATKLGVSRWTLAKYEADSSVASAGFTQKAAEFYGCPIAELYVGSAERLAEELMRGTEAHPPKPRTNAGTPERKTPHED